MALALGLIGQARSSVTVGRVGGTFQFARSGFLSENHGMKNQPFYRRVGFAARGVGIAVRTESSFRIQLFFAAGALLLLICLRPAPLWWVVVALSVGGVLAAELVNTALEVVVDRLHPEIDPMIGRAKDCAAGAVLILSLVSLGIAAALVYDWYLTG